MPAIINSDSGVITGSAGLKIHGNSDGILEIQNNGVTSLVVANSYIRVPVGNTATRPTIASAGMLRFNNQSNVFEVFNSNSWVNLSTALPRFIGNVEYLVIAGGGGGGGDDGGGGGGGGFRTGNISTFQTGVNYTVTVGGGGSGGPTAGTTAGSGSNSSIIGGVLSLSSTGGGGGGKQAPGSSSPGPGGSGGGGGYPAGIGGTGNVGGYSPPEGFPGGNSGAQIAGGGGGGASQAGNDATATNLPGKGGDGANSNILGANVTYSGGGGGGGRGTSGGAGGAGGGGLGTYSGRYRTAGSTNTGGGGGGGGDVAPLTRDGAAGGSGIIILAHANTLPATANIGAGLTYTTNTTARSGFIIYTFTAGTGTISWS